MARRGSSTIQDELYSTPDEPAREELDDARLLDLDAEKESPFLRAQKRVPARRSPLPKKTATKILWAMLAILVACVFAIGASVLYHYGQHSWRFRLNSSDDIEMTGLGNVTRSQVMEVMGGDIGRNVFFIPLDERQKQLEQIPWIESASVMRFAPNRIKIAIHERTPVAFARIGSRILLVDASGVLMDISTRKKYSFPVILGMNTGEPLSTRAARMKIYNELVRELGSSGGHYSQDLSEVDLSDAEDVKVLTNDPDGEVLVHVGSSNYLDRFKIYVAHLREWRQQFENLESVDLRYDRQIIVNPDLSGTPRQQALSAAATKAAISAGVRPAALLSRESAKNLPLKSLPVKAGGKQSVSPTLSRHGGRKHGAPTVLVSKNPAKQPHWRRHSTLIKRAAMRQPAKPVVYSSKSQLNPTAQKPSPAIAKGQAKR